MARIETPEKQPPPGKAQQQKDLGGKKIAIEKAIPKVKPEKASPRRP